MEKKTKACPFCWEEILQEAKKCKHCGEFLEETPKKKKSKMSALEWIFIIVVIIGFIWLFSDSKVDKSNVSVNEVKHYSNLNDAYNDHKNYIRNVCKEWAKLISTSESHNFEWPTYAWEYQGKFIIKWTDNWILFRCEFIPYKNEWGMNLEDVRRDI